MGSGEDWLALWGVFLEGLDPGYEARLAYLRRHPPAPVTWASSVHRVLYPLARNDGDDSDDDDGEDSDAAEERAEQERRAALLQLGLIASDAAYSIWLRQQEGVRWPWTYADTPEHAARYWTRDLAFWSRQVASLRGAPGWAPPPVPEAWQACTAPLATGAATALEPERGLRSLARVLAAGHVTPPWQLGLTPADFADSFDEDMGYVDAFRLWGMSALDDREQLQRYLDAAPPPASWAGWLAEQWPLD